MSATDLDFSLTTSTTHSGLGMGDYAFADVGNLEHCTKYLNQTLVTYGFPVSLDLFANDPVSIARTCNCIYSLLQQRQGDIEYRESANEQRQRLQSDISRLDGKIERLEAQIATKEREIATITRSEAKARANLKGQIEKLQQERDEFQKMVIGNQMEVRDLLNAPTGPKQISSMNEKHDMEPAQSPLGGRTDVFDLPFHMAREQIEESLRTKMTSIKERMVQLQDAQKGAEVSSEATERELELEAQLVEAQSIIQEQASIMSKHLAKSEKPRRVNGHLDPDRDSILPGATEAE